VIICLCHAVTDRDVDEAIDGGARTIEELGDACKVGTECGSCHEWLRCRLETEGAGPSGTKSKVARAKPVK
jgi:bacterioferritin-associated ferredoxin